MATDTVEEAAEGLAGDTQSAGSGGKLPLNAKTIKIAGLLLAVMLVQVGIGYFLLPSSSAPDAQDSAATPLADEEAATVDKTDIVEVELGSFNSTNSKAVEGTDIHVSFTLSATVSSSNQESFEEAVKKIHPARVRQAVERVTRSSSIENLNDPDLDVLKRKIKEDVNKVLDLSYIDEVILSDYKTMHQ